MEALAGATETAVMADHAGPAASHEHSAIIASRSLATGGIDFAARAAADGSPYAGDTAAPHPDLLV
jgi:hypothetical protein